jgi:hypothetical protein
MFLIGFHLFINTTNNSDLSGEGMSVKNNKIHFINFEQRISLLYNKATNLFKLFIYAWRLSSYLSQHLSALYTCQELIKFQFRLVFQTHLHLIAQLLQEEQEELEISLQDQDQLVAMIIVILSLDSQVGLQPMEPQLEVHHQLLDLDHIQLL